MIDTSMQAGMTVGGRAVFKAGIKTAIKTGIKTGIKSGLTSGVASGALAAVLALALLAVPGHSQTGGQAAAAAPGSAGALARNLKLELDRYSGGYCAEADEYCLRMSGPDTVVYTGPNGVTGQLSGLPLRKDETAIPAAQLIEVEPGRVLLGVEFASHIQMSDGRMQRRDTVYWDVDMRDGSVLGPVLEFTAHVGIDTQNCQNWPQDKQAQGCTARYVFNSIIDAIGARRDGYPVLTYRTAAVITPPGASREYGWTTPTSVSSNGEELHLGCTFRRSYIFNPLSGRYMLDQPLPDCDQFLTAELLPRRNRDQISELQMRPATPAELRNYITHAPEIETWARVPGAKVELGWLYNEMVTGADVIVLRMSRGEQCETSESCELMFFGTANCVEPALCKPNWQTKLAGNRVYSVQNPFAPLSQACRDTLILIPSGRDAGQHCVVFGGLEAEGAIPQGLGALLSRN